MSKLPSKIDRAGKYPVKWVPLPDFEHELVDLTSARTGVLHTEEGSFAGSERVFQVHYAPHFVVGVLKGVPTIWQHVPVGVIGASCRGHNDKVLVQVELEGFSKETPWLPDPVHLDLLASLMLTCWEVWEIPLSRPWADGDWGHAGANSHRKSGKLGKFAGWFGHGDMPPNDVHWDPGDLQWGKVFSHAETLSKLAALPSVTKSQPKLL